MSLVWSQLKRIEVFLVGVLNAWNIVAELLPQVGVPVRVVSIIAAALSIAALLLQDAVAAQLGGGIVSFLVAVSTSWSIIAANLTQIGATEKIVTAVGATIALLAFIAQKAWVTNQLVKNAVLDKLITALEHAEPVTPESRSCCGACNCSK